MSGHHPFSDLTTDLTPERRRRIEAMKRELLAEMPLHELRRARALTQRDMAKMLKVNQPAVSKLEQRADVYLSSLRSYIEAAGGKLKIVAEFPEGEVAITNFSDVGADKGTLEADGGHMDEYKVERYLRIIGKQTFVTYYGLLANFELPDEEVAGLIASELDTTLDSAMSWRVKPARSLIRAGQANAALLMVSQSARLPGRISQLAAELALETAAE